MDWVTAVVGLIGVIIGAGIQEFRHWRESKQRYQVMTFDKRLQIHQEAVAWCMKIATNMTPSKLREKQDIERLLGHAETAQQWLINNCLFLDSNSHASMLNVLDFAMDKAKKCVNGVPTTIDKEEEAEIAKRIGKATKCIAQGVGVKYMPDIKKRLKL